MNDMLLQELEYLAIGLPISAQTPAAAEWAIKEIARLTKERDEARAALREMLAILEANNARRGGIQPGGGSVHEAMLLAKWRKAAGLEVAP